MNEAEDLLAIHLSELLLRYDRQYRYVPARRFRADFAVWLPVRVAGAPNTLIHKPHLLVEVVGGIFTGQAHGSIKGLMADLERLNEATIAGYDVLRFTPTQVKMGEAKATIARYLERFT